LQAHSFLYLGDMPRQVRLEEMTELDAWDK